jgi:hypothetical protein
LATRDRFCRHRKSKSCGHDSDDGGGEALDGHGIGVEPALPIGIADDDRLRFVLEVGLEKGFEKCKEISGCEALVKVMASG